MYATPSKTPVDARTVERLNGLKGLTERNHLLFATAARAMSPALGGLLQLRAAEWKAGASELHRFIVDLNGVPEEGGSADPLVRTDGSGPTSAAPSDAERLVACVKAELDAAEAYQHVLELDALPTHLRYGLSRQLESAHDSRLRLESRLNSGV